MRRVQDTTMYQVDFEPLVVKNKRIVHEIWLRALPEVQRLLDAQRLGARLGQGTGH